MNARVHVVSDNGSKLATSGVEQFAIDHAAVVFAIVAEVGSNGAGAKVDVVTDDGIAEVAEVSDCGIVSDNGVFDFDRLPNVASISHGGGASEVAIWSNLAVASDNDISLNHHAWENFGSFSDV